MNEHIVIVYFRRCYIICNSPMRKIICEQCNTLYITFDIFDHQSRSSFHASPVRRTPSKSRKNAHKMSNRRGAELHSRKATVQDTFMKTRIIYPALTLSMNIHGNFHAGTCYCCMYYYYYLLLLLFFNI